MILRTSSNVFHGLFVHRGGIWGVYNLPMHLVYQAVCPVLDGTVTVSFQRKEAMPISAIRSVRARMERQTSGPFIPSSDMLTNNASGDVPIFKLLRVPSLLSSSVNTTLMDGTECLIIATNIASVERSLSTAASLIRFPSCKRIRPTPSNHETKFVSPLAYPLFP